MRQGREGGRALALALVSVATAAGAKVYLGIDEAIELAFSGCSVQRQTVYLTPEQLRRATEAAGQPVTQALVNPYVATCNGAPGGAAYFDVHRVRTLTETMMIVVAPDGTVKRLEVLSFNEPEDYLPRPAWYAQFVGKRLGDELALKQGIRPIAGATLTARATTDAVRRVLALHAAIGAPGSPRP